MTGSFIQQVMDNWYSWERRGRGHIVAPHPVELEPPFIPFSLKTAPGKIIDDGRHSLLSSLNNIFKSPPVKSSNELAELEMFPFETNSPLQVLRLSFPKEFKVKLIENEQFLLMLSYAKLPVSYEVIVTQRSIIIQFACRKADTVYIKGQINAFFPSCRIKEIDQHDDDLFLKPEPVITVTDFGLKEEFTRPCQMAQNFDIDPYASLFAILENLQNEEQAIIQILFSGTVKPWSRSIISSVVSSNGESFFVDAPEMVQYAKDKTAFPLFGVTIRIAGQAKTVQRSRMILEQLSTAIMGISRSSSNSLIALDNTDYSFETRINDIKQRQSHRLSMILNGRELSNFLHLPNVSIQPEKFGQKSRKTKTAPSIAEGHAFVLGTNEHNGIIKDVGLSKTQRLVHTHILGSTGTGKSNLLVQMICQDMEAGNSIVVLDPHGDLIDNILHRVPQKRINDVILVDPSDSSYAVGFNILNAHSEIEKEVLSSDLVATFKRFSTSWGDQMNSVLANAISAFLESSQRGTLAELRRFLIEKKYREAFLKTVNDPAIQYFWNNEYPLLKTSSIGPILTRLDSFLRPRLIRNMVTQQNCLNFEEILNSQKILLVKLSQGLIGNENSYLLGTFFVTKVYQAAIARQGKSERNDCFLYIDEFHQYITPSIVSMLEGARKFSLGLVIAHQGMQNLQKMDGEIAGAVIANAGTRICFRLGETDAKKIGEGFSFFEPPDFQNLGTGEAIVKIEQAVNSFNLTTTAIEQNNDINKVNYIIEQSRKKYSKPKHEIEARLLENLNGQPVDGNREETSPITAPELIKKIPTTPEPIDIDVNLPKESLVVPAESVLKRKEETQHRYYQNFIKRVAEAREYKATIEAPTPDGIGRVDILLEKGDQLIACEISVTTSIDWEVHNIKKCLNAGYHTIICCLSNPKSIIELKNRIAKEFTSTQVEAIRVILPEEVPTFLDSLAIPDQPLEKTIKGYRVKVEYDTLSDQDIKHKQESLTKIILSSSKSIKTKRTKNQQ